MISLPMDANTSEMSVAIAQAMCDTLSTEFDEMKCYLNSGVSLGDRNELGTINMLNGGTEPAPNTQGDHNSNQSLDRPTVAGSYVEKQNPPPNQHTIAGGHPSSVNLNPSLTMSRQAKIDNGWEPAYKILSRNPSYPGKIYRRQEISGPRPSGREFQEMKQGRRHRALEQARPQCYHGSESDGTNISSLTVNDLHVVNRDISTLSEAPIHHALRHVEGSNDANNSSDIHHLATMYIKKELCSPEQHSDDDATLLKPNGVGAEDSMIHYRYHGLKNCGCRGRRPLKHGRRRAVASVKGLALAGKARIVNIFKR